MQYSLQKPLDLSVSPVTAQVRGRDYKSILGACIEVRLQDLARKFNFG
jgi:hypothetical protein